MWARLKARNRALGLGFADARTDAETLQVQTILHNGAQSGHFPRSRYYPDRTYSKAAVPWMEPDGDASQHGPRDPGDGDNYGLEQLDSHHWSQSDQREGVAVIQRRLRPLRGALRGRGSLKRSPWDTGR